MTIDVKFYYCNPEKNTDCKKTACIITGGECALTTNENFAMIGQDGNPIECPVAILEEEVTP